MPCIKAHSHTHAHTCTHAARCWHANSSVLSTSCFACFSLSVSISCMSAAFVPNWLKLKLKLKCSLGSLTSSGAAASSSSPAHHLLLLLPHQQLAQLLLLPCSALVSSGFCFLCSPNSLYVFVLSPCPPFTLFASPHILVEHSTNLVTHSRLVVATSWAEFLSLQLNYVRCQRL